MKIVIFENYLRLHDIPRQVIDKIIKDEYLKNYSYFVTSFNGSITIIESCKEALYAFVFLLSVMYREIIIK